MRPVATIAGRWPRLVAAMLALCVAGVAATVAAGSWLTAPSPHAVAVPADLPVEHVTIPSASGSQLRAWFVPGVAGKGAIMLLHGIRGDRSALVPRARMLAAHGYALLLVDLQAHGESPGAHVTFGHLESRDADAAGRYLAARLPGERLGAIGISLGGAAIALAPRPLPVDVVVLEGVYADIGSAVRARLVSRLGSPGRWLAWPLLLQLRPRLDVSPDALRPRERLSDLGVPALLAAGDLDLHPAFQETRAMFAALKPPKSMWIAEGASHEDLYAHAPREYEQRVVGFLDRHLRRAGGP